MLIVIELLSYQYFRIDQYSETDLGVFERNVGTGFGKL